MAEGAWWQGSPRLIRMELSYQPGGCRSEKRPQLPRESGELVGERPIGARRVGGAVSHQQQLIRQGRRLSPGSACCPDPILTTPPPYVSSCPWEVTLEARWPSWGSKTWRDGGCGGLQRGEEGPGKVPCGFSCLRACFFFASYLRCVILGSQNDWSFSSQLLVLKFH